MKWIKTRPSFISEEAKIRDVINKRQADQVISQWGEKWLELEEVDATTDIEQGKWTLSEEDKLSVFTVFFKTDMKEVYKSLEKLPENFSTVLKNSINASKIGDKAKAFGETFDIRKATIDQMIFMYENVFRKLSVGETKASEIILKDDNGRPIMGEDNKIQKIQKEAGEPVYSNNLVNINSFIVDYNRSYDEQVDGSIFQRGEISQLVNHAKEDHNPDYTYDVDIFGRKMYLEIAHNAKDILNISISKFFSSCQHLYTGSYRSNVLGNVFDTNSVPAFLKFDSEIKHNDDVISDFLPLSRVMIRKVEKYTSESDDGPLIFFDRVYPDRMQQEMSRIIEKYTSNKKAEMENRDLQYVFMPDVDISDSDDLRTPYMDRLSMRKSKYIGKNTKKLYLNKEYDWSDIKISPKAKITELIIETPDVPENTFDIDMELEWVKFRFLKLKSISDFNIETDSYAFDKCSLSGEIFDEISEGVKKLQFISCEVNDVDLNNFKNLEELHLIYTLDNDINLESLLSETNVQTLEISGDIMSNVENKKFIKTLKQNGVKVKIVGPVI